MKSKTLLSLLGVFLLVGCGNKHTHTFAEEWTNDATHHWHAATCEHSDEKGDFGEHVFGDGTKCTVCGYEMPIPVNYEVTKQEWEAAWHTDKPYFMADNYQVTMDNDFNKVVQGVTLKVDGAKAMLLYESEDSTESNYFIYEENQYYVFLNEDGKWNKRSCSNPALEFAVYLELFGTNYDAFTYDPSSFSYKCESLVYQETPCVDLELKFADKQVTDARLGCQMGDGTVVTVTFAFVYGGQNITLPEN